MPMQKPLTAAEKAAIERRCARNPPTCQPTRHRHVRGRMAQGDIACIKTTGMNSLLQFMGEEAQQKSIGRYLTFALDKSGSITMDEYFLFTLSIAESVGSGIEGIFKRHATAKNLDSREFAHAVEDLRFVHWAPTVPRTRSGQ